MPVTVGVNKLSVVHQSSGGVTIAFPDVSKTPTAGAPVPIPYPNIAKTALAKQFAKVKVDGTPVMTKDSNFKMSTGDEAGTAGGGVVSSKIKGKAEYVNYSFDVKVAGAGVVRSLDPTTHNRQLEAAQLRNLLSDLNQQLQRLPKGKADQWQAVLVNYAVAASALYVTMTDDDD